MVENHFTWGTHLRPFSKRFFFGGYFRCVPVNILFVELTKFTSPISNNSVSVTRNWRFARYKRKSYMSLFRWARDSSVLKRAFIHVWWTRNCETLIVLLCKPVVKWSFISFYEHIISRAVPLCGSRCWAFAEAADTITKGPAGIAVNSKNRLFYDSLIADQDFRLSEKRPFVWESIICRANTHEMETGLHCAVCSSTRIARASSYGHIFLLSRRNDLSCLLLA